MPYGAFINLGNGLSGLVHISQICERRIKKPSEVLKEGQKVKAKSIKHKRQQDQSFHESTGRGDG